MKRLCLVALWMLSGCATVSPMEQAGAEFGKGLVSQIDKDGHVTIEALLKTAGDGLRDQVLTDATNQKLAQTVTVLGESTRQQLPAIREELIGAQTEAQLQRTVLALMTLLEARSRRLSRGVMDEVGAGLQEDVLNAATERRLNEMLVTLSTTARAESVLLRDQLLSEATDRHVKVIAATAMQEVVNASEEIRLKAREELSFVQKNANETILLAAVAGSLIAFFIWRQKEKNRLLLNLLMAQIHTNSGDKEAQILDGLRAQAQQLGVTGLLRSVLGKEKRARGNPEA